MHPGTVYDSLSVEQRFLVRLIGRYVLPEQKEALQQLVTQIDWSRFLAIASPALYPYIQDCFATRLQPDQIPEYVRSVMMRAIRENAILHLQRHAILRDILRALQLQDIPVIALKGAALAHQIYPNPLTRTMSDLDLLIPHDALKAVLAVLQPLGFQVPEYYRKQYSTMERNPAAEVSWWPLQRPGTRVFVEIHMSIESTRPPFTRSIEAVWDQSVPAVLGDLSCRVLHHEDFLVHLCTHLACHHRFEQGLRPLLDTLLYIEHREHEWDWSKLAADCRQYGYAHWVYLTLHLARTLLAAPIPEHFFTDLTPPVALDEMEHLAVEQIWHAAQFRVPEGICTLKTTPLRELPRLLWHRLPQWCQEDVAGVSTPPRMARIGWKALAHLYRMHLVPLQRAWGQGKLSKTHLDRAVQLHKGRVRIGQLIALDAREAHHV